MGDFSIEECQVLWLKKCRASKRDKEAIKTDLKGMSDVIEKAMKFMIEEVTKDKIEDRPNREIEVRLELKTRENSHSYNLHIYIDSRAICWFMCIYRKEHTRRFPTNLVGEIVNEEFSIEQTFKDEEYELPETI